MGGPTLMSKAIMAEPRQSGGPAMKGFVWDSQYLEPSNEQIANGETVKWE